MSSVSVDHVAALRVLQKAAEDASRAAYKPQSKIATGLKQIIEGSHLTFRYMALTALLAKATNANINILAVQAQAPIKNAYDARSLCHKVIVPHQNDLLRSSLGNSNEPYLNKPARTPFLSPKNPVRSGSDKVALLKLCADLPTIKTRDEAYSALCDALFFAFQKQTQQTVAIEQAVANAGSAPAKVRTFLSGLLNERHNGETLVLVTSLLYWLLSKHSKEDWTIEVHPVNEAGKSSNQISDIDIYKDQDLIHTIEVKDKDILPSDAAHAVKKVIDANGKVLHIVLGDGFQVKGGSAKTLEDDAEARGVELAVFDIKSLVQASAVWTPSLASLDEIIRKALEYVDCARMKQSTKEWLMKSIQNLSKSDRGDLSTE